MQSKILPAPVALRDHVECIRIAEHSGDEALAINVCLNGLPGLVFQHDNGRSPIEKITTPSGRTTSAPLVYVYGQMTEPSIMQHKQGPFSTIQVIFKPHALHTLLGINAAVLTDELVGLTELSAQDLAEPLLDAPCEQDRIALLTAFLLKKHQQAPMRDCLIEESLRIIHSRPGAVTVKALLETLSISERQFEKRFIQAVGISPLFYIRIKRFNAAMRLMSESHFDRLTDLAHAMNFYDQSHFIRDIKAFSGITPKALSQKVNDIHPIYSYL
jgi:AraC-like DNA-binding protein